MNAVLVLIALATASASVVGATAYFCVKRHSVTLFVVLVIVFWAVAALAIGRYSQISSLTPQRILEWRHIVDSFISMSPLVLLPAAFAVAAVAGKVTARRIPLLAIAGAIVALPLTVVVAVASSCYIAHECL